MQTRVEKAGQHTNPTIALAQRTREWERLMGGDMSSGFADISDAPSPHARVRGGDALGDDEVAIEGVWW